MYLIGVNNEMPHFFHSSYKNFNNNLIKEEVKRNKSKLRDVDIRVFRHKNNTNIFNHFSKLVSKKKIH